MTTQYSLRIQADNQFRFWLSILTFVVGAVFVAQEDVSKMLALIVLFVVYSASYGVGHLLAKADILSAFTHYFLTLADIVTVTATVYLTGGIQSPFFLLYLAILALDMYYQSLFDLVFDGVLVFLLYGGLLFYETIVEGTSFSKMIAQMGFLSLLVGFIHVLLLLSSRQQKQQKKLVSRSRTMAQVANILCGSLAGSKQWIKKVTSLIEEEIRNDGFKCRISIHKGSRQFMPPSGILKEIIIPVMVGECVFGSMIITHDAHKPLSDTDQDFFSSIAVSLGIALHRAKLWEDFREKLAKEGTDGKPAPESGEGNQPQEMHVISNADAS